jgi:hypothetical protein
VTPSEFATLTNAQRAARGRWTARCPAHDDRSPSLSIKAGEDGRVLVRCWAGCSTEAILKALNLTWRDLFAGPPPSPEQLMAMRAQRDAEETARQETMAKLERARHRVQRAEIVVGMLGAELTCTPDDDALATSFHKACELLHDAQHSLDVLKEKF